MESRTLKIIFSVLFAELAAVLVILGIFIEPAYVRLDNSLSSKYKHGFACFIKFNGGTSAVFVFGQLTTIFWNLFFGYLFWTKLRDVEFCISHANASFFV